MKDVEAAARSFGLQILFLNANTAGEIDVAFERIEHERPAALFVGQSPFLNARRVQLVQLAARHMIPAAYASREFSEIGGLMSYGSDVSEAYRQVGIYTGRILKGAKPGDLPVMQSSKIELVINHQTARMLRISVAPSLIATADEVIE